METLREFLNSGAPKDDNYISITEEISKLKELDKTLIDLELSENMVNRKFKHLKRDTI